MGLSSLVVMASNWTMKKKQKIEVLLDAAEDTLPRPSAEGLGTLVDYPEGLRKYEGYLVSTGTPLEGMKVALDTANWGSFY